MVGGTYKSISVLKLSSLNFGKKNLLTARDNTNSRQNCFQLAAYACTWIISATEHKRFFPLISLLFSFVMRNNSSIFASLNK